jgi:phenylalanine-4-hydroxylase
MSDKPKILAWDPFDAAMRDYPITTYQPVYYLAKSFEDAKIKMRDFSASMAKPCRVRYNEFTQSIEVDSSVRMMPPQRRT